jgi:uncharacterized Tic20 family protein
MAYDALPPDDAHGVPRDTTGRPARGLPAGDPAPRPQRRTTPGSPPFGERYVAAEVEPLSPRDERRYAALAHLSQLAGIVVAPMLLLASVGRQSLYVDRHAKEAFNFQLTYVLLFVAAVVVALRGTGPAVIGGVAAYGVAFAGFAALRSWQGAFFRYPLAIRFLR